MGVLQSSLRVSLVDHVTGPARGIMGVLGRLRATGNGLFAPLNSGIGRLAALGVGFVGLSSGIEGTIGAARAMQAQLTEIGIKAGLSDTQIASLRQRMIALRPTVNQTTGELLSGVDAMVTLGLSADDAAAAMPAIGRAATASLSSIADLSAASVAAMQNLGVGPQEITRMLDGMTEAGNAGAFEMRDMAQYFPQLTASAKSLGMEGVDAILDMAAALQIARRGTGDASTAANNLSNFLGKIMAPETIRNFKKFGVNVTKELQKAHKLGISPIEHFVKLINEKTKGGRADLLGQLFGDKQVLDFIRPLLSDFDDYLRIRDQAERATGASAEAYARRMQDAEQKMKSFRIAMENIGTTIGGKVLGPLGDFAGRLAYLLDTSDRRVNLFDQFQARFDAFASGLGQGSGMEMLQKIGAWLEGGIFGRESTFDRDVESLTQAAGSFRAFGASVRGLGEDLGNGEVMKAFSGFGGAFRDLSSGVALGSLVGLSMAGGAFKMLAGGVAALAMSKLGRMVLVSVAIGSIIEAAQGAESVGELANNLSDLSAIEWAGIAAGIGMLAGPTMRLARHARGLAGALGLISAAGGVAALAGDGKGGKGVPGKPGAGLPFLTPLGGSLFAVAGVAAIAALIAKYGPEAAKKGTKKFERGTPGWWLGLDPTETREERLTRLNERPARSQGGPLTRGRYRGDGRVEALDAFLAPPPGTKAQVDAISALLKEATKDWPAAAQQGIADYANAIAVGGDLAETEAQNIGTGIKEALSVTGQPDVDTSKLSQALDLARQLGVEVRALGGSKVSVPQIPRLDGQRAKGGPVRRGGTYLVGEKGPELASFGRDGFVHDAASTAMALDGLQSLRRPSAPATFASRPGRIVNINDGAIAVHVHAAPGQSVESIAAAVERILSGKLTHLSNRAFHDGVY